MIFIQKHKCGLLSWSFIIVAFSGITLFTNVMSTLFASQISPMILRINNDDKHTLSLIETQSIINSYIKQLSDSNYSNVKDKIIIQKRFTNFTFPHLNVNHMISAFGNKNIWIAGDSTVENLYIYLLWIFTEYNSNNTNFQYKKRLSFHFNLTLIRENWPRIYINPSNNNSNYYSIKNLNIGSGSGSTTNPLIYRHFNDYNISFFGGKVQRCAYYPPPNIIHALGVDIDIIISNFDLLFCLHIMNPFTVERLHTMPLETLKANLEFENMLEIFVNNSMDEGVKCMIFFGANTVDNSKYYGNWKQLVKVWINDVRNETALDVCLKAIRHRYHPEHVLVNLTNTTGFVMTAFDLCKKGILASIGAYWTSERLYSWIEWKQKQLHGTQFKLLYWNQTQITDNRGEYTDDGRHYLPIVPVKTEVITNIISNFCK
eukprot:418365_1